MGCGGERRTPVIASVGMAVAPSFCASLSECSQSVRRSVEINTSVSSGAPEGWGSDPSRTGVERGGSATDVDNLETHA